MTLYVVGKNTKTTRGKDLFPVVVFLGSISDPPGCSPLYHEHDHEAFKFTKLAAAEMAACFVGGFVKEYTE